MDKGFHLDAVFFNTIVGRDTYLVGVITIGDYVQTKGLTVLQSSLEGVLQVLANILRVDAVIKTNNVVTSTGEVDTEVQFAEDMRFQTQDSEDYHCS